MISPRSKYFGGRNGGKRGGVGVSYGRQSPPGEAPLLPSSSPAAGRVDPELGAPRSPPRSPPEPSPEPSGAPPGALGDRDRLLGSGETEPGTGAAAAHPGAAFPARMLRAGDGR